MKSEETTAKPLVVSILSLSLLTVMAGAAVAPALGVIQEYFADSSPVLVQMIISIPAIFIVITNSIFPRLCKKFGAKALTMIGLLLYTVGGCIAGAFSQIVLVLIMRAFVGIGVGIIMPLSTGLLSFYFPPEKQAKLMGYSSAMNQMGGVVATLLSGVLATISWRLSFHEIHKETEPPAVWCSGNHQLAAQFPCVSHGVFQHNTLRDLRAQ